MSEVAILTVLYSQEPTEGEGEYIQVRRWDTPEHSELIMEHGRLVAGELSTRCEVLPFFYTPEQALATLARNNGHA